MTRAGILLVLLLAAPRPAAAGCTLSMRCVSASRASAPPKHFEDEGACRRTAASANSQYPGCTYTCACSGSASGSGSSGGGAGYGGGGFDPGQELLLQGSYALGQAIGAALFGGGRSDAAEEAARQRRLQEAEEQERLERERAEERRRAFEADKKELLGEIKGGSSASYDMDFKGVREGKYAAPGSGGDSPELSFKEYHDRETERLETLKKLAHDAVTIVQKAVLDWCKLHPPLYPSRSGATDDESYRGRLEDYNARQRAWKQYCEQDFAEVETITLRSFPKGAGLTLHADCFGAFEKESAACSGHSTALGNSECISRALQAYAKCPGPGVPVTPAPAAAPTPSK